MISKQSVKQYLTIIFGTFITAVAVYFFLLAGNLSIGTVSSLARLVSTLLPLPISVITLVMNLTLLLISYFFIGREFALRTVLGAVLLPVFLWVFEVIFPNFQSLTQDPFLDMLGYIFVVGIGLALLFSCNASTGGIEVVAKLMNKYMHMDLGQASAVSGMAVAILAGMNQDKKTLIVSIIGTYLGGLVMDHFIFDLNIKRKVCIISQEVDKILDYILYELHSGASVYEVIGAYDKTKRREINVIVDKQEYHQLMEYLKKTDPKAFVTVYSVNEINYIPKK